MRSTRNEDDDTTVANNLKNFKTATQPSEELMCSNSPQLIYDWISEYERLSSESSELTSFAAEHETDPEIAEAIFTVFNERQRHEQLIHTICQQLLGFYRSNEETLQRFSLQFIPVLIHSYLQAVAAGDKRNARSIETLLICIYNAEVSTEDGAPRAVTFRMPILAHPSVYHEEKNLPLTDLRRWEENCNREVKWGPHMQIEAITAQSRLRIMTALLFCYNQQLSQMQKPALLHLCRVASQLVSQGFTKQTTHSMHRISFGSDQSVLPKSALSRIPLSAPFLVELVHAIYFAMFNGYGTVAIQTLEDIHTRACFEMYAELILVTSAVRNSLHANPSGQPSDGPMGLSVALTPATNTVTTSVSKSMITNASFRTKKLPDDIPIQVTDLTMQQTSQPLSSVIEESDVSTAKEQGGSGTGLQQSSTRNSIIRPSMEGIKAQAHKALIAGFKKSKDKEKEKGREKDKEQDKERDKEREPPKPPQRKFEKHSQRNSLLQLQAEGTAMAIAAAAAVVEYEKRAGVTYDSLDSMEMLPIQTNMDSGGSGSGSFSVDSELNGMAGGSANMLNNNSNINNNNSNNNSLASNTTLTAVGAGATSNIDMLATKSFDSNTIELSNMGVSNKYTEVGE